MNHPSDLPGQLGIVFDGDTFDPAQDAARLANQLIAVRGHLLRHPGEWFTLTTLAAVLRYPEASVSARLRDLRKPRFGGYEIARRRTHPGQGTWEYSLIGKLAP